MTETGLGCYFKGVKVVPANVKVGAFNSPAFTCRL